MGKSATKQKPTQKQSTTARKNTTKLKTNSLHKPYLKPNSKKSLKNTDAETLLSLNTQHDDLMDLLTNNSEESSLAKISSSISNIEKQKQFNDDKNNLDETLNLFNRLH